MIRKANNEDNFEYRIKFVCERCFINLSFYKHKYKYKRSHTTSSSAIQKLPAKRLVR